MRAIWFLANIVMLATIGSSSGIFYGCISGEFQCQNGDCIQEYLICDGSIDCMDGSDEENCTVSVPVYSVDADCTLDNQRYLCKDRQLCVGISELCNDHEACFDGSDEGGFCHQKVECRHANCSTEQCYSSPDGQFCLCDKGYKHKNGGCVDIDECEAFGICDQKCNNSVGGYRCSCDQGYLLQKDGHTCRVEGGKEPLIYFSNGKEIRVRFLKSGLYHTLAANLTLAIGVEVHNLHVYWTSIDEGEEAIFKAHVLRKEFTTIVDTGLAEPEDLAVDWITGNIYFTDSRYKFIGVCSSDANHCTVLHNRDINNPRGIALLPYKGYVYWSDWGFKPVIARSGMDGSDVFDFVSKDIGWPNGITIDHGNQRLYWVDAKMASIESIRLDGKDRRKVLKHSSLMPHLFSISVFEDTVYWSDWETMKIESANKFTGKSRKTVVKDKNKIFGIKVYHPAMHDRNEINYCLGSPCTDLCLLAPERVGQGPPASRRRYTCACPDGKELSANNHSCVETAKTPIIVIGKRKMSSVDMETLQSRDIVTSGDGRIEEYAGRSLVPETTKMNQTTSIPENIELEGVASTTHDPRVQDPHSSLPKFGLEMKGLGINATMAGQNETEVALQESKISTVQRKLTPSVSTTEHPRVQYFNSSTSKIGPELRGLENDFAMAEHNKTETTSKQSETINRENEAHEEQSRMPEEHSEILPLESELGYNATMTGRNGTKTSSDDLEVIENKVHEDQSKMAEEDRKTFSLELGQGYNATKMTGIDETQNALQESKPIILQNENHEEHPKTPEENHSTSLHEFGHGCNTKMTGLNGTDIALKEVIVLQKRIYEEQLIRAREVHELRMAELKLRIEEKKLAIKLLEKDLERMI